MPLLAPRLIAPSFELSPIKAIELEASRIPGAISLAQGIPSFHPPQVIKDFVQEKIREGACDKYSLTNGLSELREEISEAVKKEGLVYDPDTEVIVTAGSIEGITAALLASTEPGDEVILPSPTYASYLGGIAIARCTPRYVALEEDSNFDFSIEAMEKIISRKTKAILYCSPNNPTGTVFSKEKTEAIVRLAQINGITLIVDEVYKEFYYGDDRHFSPAQVSDAHDFVIRVCSFSKAYGMTGWRVGFVLGAKEHIIKMLKYHDAMVTCAPVVSQYGAIAALRHGDEFFADCLREYRRRRDYAIERLDGLSDKLDYQLPQATYFVFPRLKDSIPLARDSRRFAYDLLEKAHLAVVPGIAFGPTGEAHIRINIGRDFEDIQEGFDRLADYLSSGKRANNLPRLKERDKGSVDLISSRLILKKTVIFVLALAARIYLWRAKSKVIGIVGLLGKTVFKRTIYNELKGQYKIRAGHLSFNTEIGLPLAILDLKLPNGLAGHILFPFKILYKLLFNKDRNRYLVLEYGVTDPDNALRLAKIAKPDYLLLTSALSPEPADDQVTFLHGLKAFMRKTNPEYVLCFEEDLAAAKLIDLETLIGANALISLKDSFTDLHQRSIVAVGKGAQRAIVAAEKLREILN